MTNYAVAFFLRKHEQCRRMANYSYSGHQPDQADLVIACFFAKRGLDHKRQFGLLQGPAWHRCVLQMAQCSAWTSGFVILATPSLYDAPIFHSVVKVALGEESMG